MIDFQQIRQDKEGSAELLKYAEDTAVQVSQAVSGLPSKPLDQVTKANLENLAKYEI